MKKITKELFDSLKPAQQEMIKSLGIPIEENVKPERLSRRVTDSVLEKYACLVETSCKLCKSINTKVFEMEGVGGLLVSHEATLESVDGLTIKTRYETTLTCPCCHDHLKLMSQEDLIALTIKTAKGECRCKKE